MNMVTGKFCGADCHACRFIQLARHAGYLIQEKPTLQALSSPSLVLAFSLHLGSSNIVISMGSLPLLMVSIIPAIFTVIGCHMLMSAHAHLLPQLPSQKKVQPGIMDVQVIEHGEHGAGKRQETRSSYRLFEEQRSPHLPDLGRYLEGAKGEYDYYDPSPSMFPGAEVAPIPHR